MKYSLLCLLFSLCCAACTSSNSGSKKEAVDTTRPTTQTAPPENLVNYPSIPLDLLQQLFQECDYLDVIFNGSFYGVSMSMSQDQKRDIQQSVSFISSGNVAVNPACKAVGRMFFLKQGETLIEADFFMQNNCQYYIFYEGKTPKYANAMSDQGVKYLNAIIKQARQGQGQ